MLKNRALQLSLFITFVLMVSLLLSLDLPKLGDIFANLRWTYFALGLVPLFFEVSLKALRTRVFTQLWTPLSLKDAYIVTLIGFPFGTITPGRVGDLVKVHILSQKTGLPMTKAFVVGMAEKIIDLLTLFALVGAGVAMLFMQGIGGTPLLFILLFAIASGVSIFILLQGTLMRPLFRLFYEKVIPQRLHEKLHMAFDEFYGTLGLILSTRKTLVAGVGFGGLLWISRTMQVYLFLKALGLSVAMDYFLAIIPLTYVAEIIPITIMGFGVREYTFLLLFQFAGVTPEASVALALMVFAFGILPPAILGYVVALKEYAKKIEH